MLSLLKDILIPAREASDDFVSHIRKKYLNLPYITDLGDTRLNEFQNSNHNKKYYLISSLSDLNLNLFEIRASQLKNQLFDVEEPQKIMNVDENSILQTVMREAVFYEYYQGGLKDLSTVEKIGPLLLYLPLLMKNTDRYLTLTLFDYRNKDFGDRQDELIALFADYSRKISDILENYWQLIKKDIPLKTKEGDKPLVATIENYISELIKKSKKENNQSILYGFLKDFSLDIKTQESQESQITKLIYDMLREFIYISNQFNLNKALVSAANNKGRQISSDTEKELTDFKQKLFTSISMIRSLPGHQEEIGILYNSLFIWALSYLANINHTTWYRNDYLMEIQNIITPLFLDQEKTIGIVAGSCGVDSSVADSSEQCTNTEI